MKIKDRGKNVMELQTGTVEGQEIMNRFRTGISDPVLKRMDYRTGCIKAAEIIHEQGIVEPDEIMAKVKGCRENCERLNLLVNQREQYVKNYPGAAKSGLTGPDVNQFCLMDPFCQACLMAQLTGLHRSLRERFARWRQARKETKLMDLIDLRLSSRDHKIGWRKGRRLRKAGLLYEEEEWDLKADQLIEQVELRKAEGLKPKRSQLRKLRKAGLPKEREVHSPGNDEEGMLEQPDPEPIPEVPAEPIVAAPAVAPPIIDTSNVGVRSPVVHGTEKGLFPCTEKGCTSSFPTKKRLNAHRRKVHGIYQVKVTGSPSKGATEKTVKVDRDAVMRLRTSQVRGRSQTRPDMSGLVKKGKVG